jgi:hypothetical protein
MNEHETGKEQIPPKISFALKKQSSLLKTGELGKKKKAGHKVGF